MMVIMMIRLCFMDLPQQQQQQQQGYRRNGALCLSLCRPGSVDYIAEEQNGCESIAA